MATKKWTFHASIFSCEKCEPKSRLNINVNSYYPYKTMNILEPVVSFCSSETMKWRTRSFSFTSKRKKRLTFLIKSFTLDSQRSFQPRGDKVPVIGVNVTSILIEVTCWLQQNNQFCFSSGGKRVESEMWYWQQMFHTISVCFPLLAPKG